MGRTPHGPAIPAHRRYGAGVSVPSSALRATFPVLLGYVPLGVTFGVLLVGSGLEWWWAPIWSTLVYAGSLEFLLVGLVTSGATLAQIAVASLAVNFRHAFYGLSHPLSKVRSRPGRWYAVWSLTDEAFALLAPLRRAPVTGRFVVTAHALCHVYWVSGATLGALLGSRLDLDLAGLEFVLTALFAVLSVDAYRASPDRRALGTALVCGLVGAVLLGGNMLVPSLSVFTAILVVQWWRSDPGRARSAAPRDPGGGTRA